MDLNAVGKQSEWKIALCNVIFNKFSQGKQRNYHDKPSVISKTEFKLDVFRAGAKEQHSAY